MPYFDKKTHTEKVEKKAFFSHASNTRHASNTQNHKKIGKNSRHACEYASVGNAVNYIGCISLQADSILCSTTPGLSPVKFDLERHAHYIW